MSSPFGHPDEALRLPLLSPGESSPTHVHLEIPPISSPRAEPPPYKHPSPRKEQSDFSSGQADHQREASTHSITPSKQPSATRPVSHSFNRKVLLALCLVVLVQVFLFVALGSSWPRRLSVPWVLFKSSTPSAGGHATVNCSTPAATWSERSLKEFANVTGAGTGLGRLSSPFLPFDDDDVYVNAMAGPYPTRNHFFTCDAIFSEPRPSPPMTAPTPTATINPFRGPGPAAAPAEKAPAQAGSPGFVTQKFFVEAWEDYHRDKRFGTPRARVKVAVKDPITGRTHQMSEPGAPRHEVRAALTDLVAAWSAFAAATHTTAWLAHGTLMGWWWSGAALPWDDDIDLQMTLRDLETLAARHHGARWGDDGRFLLEVNPNRVHRWHEKPNAIDARFIDTKTGRFLDITALASSVDPADAMRNPPEAQMWLTCKSLHFYDFRDLFPLRRSTFEGIDVYVPFNVKRVLQMEYGGSSVSRTSFRNHEYNTTSKTWVQMPSS